MISAPNIFLSRRSFIAIDPGLSILRFEMSTEACHGHIGLIGSFSRASGPEWQVASPQLIAALCFLKLLQFR